MKSESQVAKELQELAEQVFHIVAINSAGELSRGRNWEFFVKAIPNDHNLRELAQECFDALPDDQKRPFLGHIDRRNTPG